MARKVTVCMAVWNTAHLLARSLETYAKQTFDDFDIIIIDDCSEDDVEAVVAPWRDKLKIQVHRFVHGDGMRGNTVSFNTAFSLASGQIIFESTPEIMLYPDCIGEMVYTLSSLGPKSWASVRTYNLTAPDQLVIDDVDWREDINALRTLPNFDDPWTQNNTKQEFFGTHQTCVFYRRDWFLYWERYPLFADYGTDDPHNAGVRQRVGIASATITPFVWHQWHAPIGFWMAEGKAPNWNMWGHTLRNVYNEPSVPDGGTAEVWDNDKPEGCHHQMTPEEGENWLHLKDSVIATGFRRKDGKDW